MVREYWFVVMLIIMMIKINGSLQYEYYKNEAILHETEKSSFTKSTSAAFTPGNTLNTSTSSDIIIDNLLCPSGLSICRKCNQVYCYVVTEKHAFPPKCPYPNFLPIHQVDRTLLVDKEVWVMAKRNTTDGFGPFVWIRGHQYGQPVTSYRQTFGNLTTETCMITKGSNTLVPVNCNDPHQALCVYHYDVSKFGSSYCRNQYVHDDGYPSCIPDSLDKENHACYCESNINTIQAVDQQNRIGTRDLFCKKLAEPISKMQNHILVNYLQPDFSRCWFGLVNVAYANETHELQWTVSEERLNYTHWAKLENTDPTKPFGAIKLYEDPGWVLADDVGQIQCGICEIKNDYNSQVTVLLAYDVYPTVSVTITNSIELSDLDDKFHYFFCFVGPTESNFAERVLEFPQSNIAKDPVTLYITNYFEYPVYYWCEGFQRPNLTPVYSNRILVPVSVHQSGHEYALRVTCHTIAHRDPYLDDLPLQATGYIEDRLGWNYCMVKPMKVLSYNQEINQMEVLAHITSFATENEEEEYDYILEQLNWMVKENDLVANFSGFVRCDVCRRSRTTSSRIQLLWPQSALGEIVVLSPPCLQYNGEPVTRTCEGDFMYGAHWSEPVGDCQSETTSKLNDLLNNPDLTPKELGGNLSVITEENQDVTVTDIYLISEILEKLAAFDDDIVADDVVQSISNVMDFDADQLRSSQKTLNCTDKMLYSLDRVVEKIQVHKRDTYMVIGAQRLLVQVSNVKATQITGLSLRKISDENNSFNSFKLTPIYSNTTIEELLEDNLDLAALLPQDLVKQMEEAGKNVLAMTLFYNDVFFNENITKLRQANSRILSVLIPGFNRHFNSSIPVIVKPFDKNNFENKCAYWNYGYAGGTTSKIQGSWLEETDAEDIGDELTICSFNHTTHFAQLMTSGSPNEDNPQEPQDKHTQALNIITIIGVTLSLSSITAMFVVALILKSWRQNCSTKILLNFSVAIALQMILLYAASFVDKNSHWCTVVGASLHYMILSEFLWMLIIAVLHYIKFVIVFHDRIPHFLAKSCVLCWGVPLVPITIFLAISNDIYLNNPNGLCYPSGNYFYFGLVLPIFVTVSINGLILIKVLLSVCQKKIESFGPNQHDVTLQVLLGVFLFFLLGISWVFGLAVSFGGGVVFSYLFCLTATFQGLVMFLFFVVLNQKFHLLWLSLQRIFCVYRRRRTSSLRRIPESVSSSQSDTKN